MVLELVCEMNMMGFCVCGLVLLGCKYFLLGIFPDWSQTGRSLVVLGQDHS